MPYANAVYANLALVPNAPKRSAVERKAAAVSSRDAETKLKRTVDRAHAVLNRLEAREAEIASLIKALQKRKAATCAKKERIEDEILTRMDDAGLKVLTGLHCSMRMQNAAEALEVIDETKIPREFLRQPKTPPAAPDKVALKKAFAENEDLNPADFGCRLTSKVSLIRK